jgi:hypothetical protein
MEFIKNNIKAFFENSNFLDRDVLRPLSHINLNWELIWNSNSNEYEREDCSFASLLNDLIKEISITVPPKSYHDNEDYLARLVNKSLNWKIYKKGKLWIGNDYISILENGGFYDINEHNLIKAATGRIKAAIDRSQNHFDNMEHSHKRVLSSILTIIIYHKQFSI